MEASPQQQFSTGDGSVRVLADRLVIEGLTIEDDRAARVVRERAEAGHPPADTVVDAVEIGARVLDREGTAAEVDYVRAEFERSQGELRERMAERDRLLTERIRTELNAVPQDIKERVERMLAETRQTQLSEVLKELGGRQDRILREIRESTAREQTEMRNKIAELTAELARSAERYEADRRVGEAEEAGTRKGRSFEQRVHDAVERLAAARGDCAHHVGDEAGAGGSKKGDTVVEIGAAEGPPLGRIAFEAKDSQLSRPKAWEELNGALVARSADFAVFVVAGTQSIPPGREQLTEYEGNKLIVAVDAETPDEAALDVAYRFARLRVLLAHETALTVDAAGVRGAAAEAKAALEAAKAIKSSLTKATNNVDQARVAIEGMVAGVLDRIERIESLVSPAE